MVETIRLESGHTLTGIGGSNPSLSAIALRSFDSAPLRSGFRQRAQTPAKRLKFESLPLRQSPSIIMHSKR